MFKFYVSIYRHTSLHIVVGDYINSTKKDIFMFVVCLVVSFYICFHIYVNHAVSIYHKLYPLYLSRHTSVNNKSLYWIVYIFRFYKVQVNKLTATMVNELNNVYFREIGFYIFKI